MTNFKENKVKKGDPCCKCGSMLDDDGNLVVLSEVRYTWTKNGIDYYGKDCPRCNNLENNYGLNSLEYDWLHFLHDRTCDWPGCEETSVHFDHDHETGEFRGFLCHCHNTGLGKIGDNLAGAAAAVQYLVKDHGKTTY